MTEADATKISKQINSDIGLNKRKDRNMYIILWIFTVLQI